MIGFYNYTVILTYLGLASSVLGIFQALKGEPTLAVVCLVFAGICDLFDGKVARTMDRTPQEKRFGIQIDSLCDLISFSILPVMIGYSLAGCDRWFLQCVYVFFVLAAVIRLAYYNVTEEERQRTETGDREYFEGMPVTLDAIIIPVMFLFKGHVTEQFFANMYVIMLFIVAVAFIAGVKIKKHPITSRIRNK